MADKSTPADQSHPLYAEDRINLNQLLACKNPTEAHLIDLARLLIRYNSFPGAIDLQRDMIRVLDLWGLSHEELNQRVRKLWSSGFRPGNALATGIGSGFDTAEVDGISDVKLRKSKTRQQGITK